jgi:hypothetical protein
MPEMVAGNESVAALGTHLAGHCMSIVYVDLSAKVEQWTRDSAVAVCDGFSRVYLVPSRDKQKARDLIIRLHGRTNVQYRVFAVLIYLAIRADLPNIQQIVVDRDYPGSHQEGTIKNFLLNHLRKDWPKVTAGFIRFENVAGSRADALAREVFLREAQPDGVVSYQEIGAVLRK